MSSISFETFKEVLRELNPNLRALASRTKRSSMIYLRNGFHPDTGQDHLMELFAYPSPSHGSFPKYDFIDKGGLRGRGYTTVFKMLVQKRLVSRDRLRMLLPQALDPCRGRPENRWEDPHAVPEIPVYASPVRATRLRIRR